MGAWGPGLYQDDVARDVRDEFKDQLHRHKEAVELTQELIETYWEAIEDKEDGPVFWFALADTQWNLGRLQPQVKEQALHWLEEGSDLRRWQAEGRPADVKKRAQVLEKLKEKLLSPQPPQKKISQYRLYQCQWKIGDVFAYQLEGELAAEKGVKGHYVYFVKASEREWHPGHIIPRVYLFKQMGPELLDIQQLKPELFAWSVEVTHGKGYPTLFALIQTSQRAIPSKLIYLGNRTDLPLAIDEANRRLHTTFWEDFESYIQALYS